MESLILSITLQLPMLIVVTIGSVVLVKRRIRNRSVFILGAIGFLCVSILAIPFSEFVVANYGSSIDMVAYVTFGVGLLSAMFVAIMFYAFSKGETNDS